MTTTATTGYALRKGAERACSLLQPGFWDALDIGVLVTDLDHVSIFCNRAFGEIFQVEPLKVVTSGVDELRERVLPYLDDPEAWIANLDDIYRDPMGVQRDELAFGESENRVERYTGPVLDSNGKPVARLWTFRPVRTEADHSIVCGELEIDLDGRMATINDTKIVLTRFEFELLVQLAQNRDTAMGREILFRRVWGYDMDLNTNSLDVLISRLRKKIQAVGESSVKIETVYAYGYRMVVKDS